MDFKPDYLLLVGFSIFVAFVLYFILQIAAKGLKGTMFGGKIHKTYGEIELEKRGIMAGKLIVHTVESKTGTKIGIEVLPRSQVGFQMVPVRLSNEEARRLIQLLTQATSDT